MATIVVAGAVANKPANGGEAWVRLSWVRGLARLGYDVWLVEQLASEDFAADPGRAYFDRVAEAFGLRDRAVLVDAVSLETSGVAHRELLDVAAEADLLVNVSGHLTLEPLLGRFRRRAFVDLDPGYTQLWQAAGLLGNAVERHHVHFTVGEAIGTAACELPTGGIRWVPVRQPCVLDDWPVATGGEPDRFTTVASWRGAYGPATDGRRTYGVKAHEFRKLAGLPGRSRGRFEIALAIDPADGHDRELMTAEGWRIVDPTRAAGDPCAFRDYVASSGAECSAAQGIYVETACGWFGDRTVRYLASGRPALVQDTGFTSRLPAGDGLVAFRTLEEAAAGAERILADPDAHGRAARAIAESFFDSDLVLARFLEAAL